MNYLDTFITSFFYIKFELALLLTACYLILLRLSTKFTSLRFTQMDYLAASMFFAILLFQISIDKLEGCTSTLYFFNNHITYNYYIKLIKASMAVYIFIYLWFVRLFSEIIVIPLVEFLALFFFAIFSLSIIISSNHLFVIFLFLEITNISLYCLIGLNKNSNKGIEAAYKYFIQSAFATILGFFAISLIYVQTGTLFLNELTIFFNDLAVSNMPVALKLSLYMLIIVIFFKLGLFPLHS